MSKKQRKKMEIPVIFEKFRRKSKTLMKLSKSVSEKEETGGDGIKVNYYDGEIYEIPIIIIPISDGTNSDDCKDMRFKMLLEMAYPDKEIASMRFDDDPKLPESIEKDVLCDLYGYVVVPKGFIEERVLTSNEEILFLENTGFEIFDTKKTTTLKVG